MQQRYQTVTSKPHPADINAVTPEERQKAIDEEKEREAQAAADEKKSTYKKWAQYNLDNTANMIELAMKNPKAVAILFFLVDQMGKNNAVVLTYQIIQEVLDISRSTAIRSVAYLQEKGFITILKSGNTNVYTVNDNVFWKSWGKNRRYSRFPANVVLSLSDQSKDYQIKIEDLMRSNVNVLSVKDEEPMFDPTKYEIRD